MLILNRRIGQTIVVGDVVITLTKARKGNATIGITAPSEVLILRGELEPIDSDVDTVLYDDADEAVKDHTS